MKAHLARGDDELIPLELVNRRLTGESTVKVWREYRGLTQLALAKASGHEIGGITTLKKLAATLQVDLDQLA